jgi:hypothetical protein
MSDWPPPPRSRRDAGLACLLVALLAATVAVIVILAVLGFGLGYLFGAPPSGAHPPIA